MWQFWSALCVYLYKCSSYITICGSLLSDLTVVGHLFSSRNLNVNTGWKHCTAYFEEKWMVVWNKVCSQINIEIMMNWNSLVHSRNCDYLSPLIHFLFSTLRSIGCRLMWHDKTWQKQGFSCLSILVHQRRSTVASELHKHFFGTN